MTMMGYAYFEEGALPDDGEYDSVSAEIEAFRLPKGPLPVRRTHYFNHVWHEKIISHNLRVGLVDFIAKHYVNRGIALCDLIKEGNLGLTHALENFELEGGSRFSTYAARCIRQHIERAIKSQSGISRSSSASKVMLSPTNADQHLCRKRISSRGDKTHH
jgi:hypothetical protein